MSVLDGKLRELKKRGSAENKDLFYEICGDLDGILEADGKTGPGGDPGRSPAGAVSLAKKLTWLRTLPLEDMNMFVAMHPGFEDSPSGESRGAHAGILGLWAGPGGQELALAEVQAGKNGPHALYAVAEGLKNLAIAWHDMPLAGRRWKARYEKEWASAWRKKDPFRGLNENQARLVLIGNPRWINENAEPYLHLLPETVKIGGLHAEVSVYSAGKDGGPGISPPLLLPLKKIHPVRKHILDVLADVYSSRY